MHKTPVNKFDFFLPEELIAQFPHEKRDESRLLHLERESGSVSDLVFKDVLNLLSEDDFIVVNNTKVIKARMYGKKSTGGKIEVLLVEDLGENAFKAMVKGKVRPGDVISIGDNKVEVIDMSGELRILKFEDDAYELMDKFGHIPLPPYIKREDSQFDATRYQTVYSKEGTSVAAPTAGLHFTDDLLKKLQDKGVDLVEITLNVGIGTFKPVKCDYIEEHKMHCEKFTVTKDAMEKINLLKSKGKRLIAVGTTTVRALESIADIDGFIHKYGSFETDIFIRPGYKFKIVDKLITNFHLPKSTLLMLVSAFAGYENVMKAYEYAVKQKYRFFSYGDAMFID